MRSRLTVSLVASAAILALAGPTHASAATEFGDTCAADEAGPGSYTLMTSSSPGSGLPLSAPVGGVITKVKLRTQESPPIPIPEVIKLLRPAGGDSYTVVNQVPMQVLGGETVADARMPVQAGDRLGVYSPPFTAGESSVPGYIFLCDNVPGGLGAALGEVGLGSTASFPPATEARVPLSAVIEPDADNDGYGDETQDKCPQSAAVQIACPVVTLDAVGLPGAKSVVVMVATSTSAPVSVNGVVSLGKGKKATLKAGTKTVAAGQLVRFKLKFSSKLTERLQELEPSKKLTLKITASATNVAGQISSDQIKAKLKGQS